MTHIDGSYAENRDEYLRQLGKVSPAVRWYRHDLVPLLMWALQFTAKGIDSRFVRRFPEIFRGDAEDVISLEPAKLPTLVDWIHVKYPDETDRNIDVRAKVTMSAEEALKTLRSTGENRNCVCGGRGYVYSKFGRERCYCVIDKMYEGEDGE